MKIEICANSFASAQAAQFAGADRIELCTQLSVGGLTPSFGLIKKVMAELSIPVHVLIRPRAGNFVYSTCELDIMVRDIVFCKKLGCAGVVSGALRNDTSLDKVAINTLLKAAGAMEFTFHRAFDVISNPSETLKNLQELGVTRVLSSGQQIKAIDGIDLLKKMKDISGNIQIMPGSGIHKNNVLAFKNAGFEAIHFSAISKVVAMPTKNIVSFQEGVEGSSNQEEIETIITLLSS